jgi:hypothetical protein
MKTKPQIRIVEFLSHISIHCPQSPKNNEVFKHLGGQHCTSGRWLLPATAAAQLLICKIS